MSETKLLTRREVDRILALKPNATTSHRQCAATIDALAKDLRLLRHVIVNSRFPNAEQAQSVQIVEDHWHATGYLEGQ